MTDDLLLTRGVQRASVSTHGGRLVSYDVAGRPVVARNVPADAYPGALLVPWPNRVADGTWSWRGQQFRLPVNEPSRRTALHGLVTDVPFVVAEHNGARAVLRHELGQSDGYPFALQVESEYELVDTGLQCALRARNTGEQEVPVALGVHPYVDTRGPVDDVVLRLSARTLLLADEQWEETGRAHVQQTELDFLAPRRIGAAAIDASWTDLAHDEDGRVRCRVELPDGDAVTVWGGRTMRWLVVFNADALTGNAHRRCLAVEPNTAPANALRSGNDLDVLAPDELLELEWGLAPSWLDRVSAP